MSRLYQSLHIHHQTEAQIDSKTRREFLWTVYLRLICLPSWVPEAELCSALPVPQSCHQTDKPLTSVSPTELRPRWILQTAVAPWQNNPSLMLSFLPLSRIFVLGLGSRIRKSSWWRGRDIAASHFQVRWRVRAGSQAPLCWHIWDLQLSAGEICTAESAGEGKRASLEAGKHGLRWRKNWKTGQLLTW